MATEKELAELYISILGRAPDAQGLTFWMNAVSQGVTLEQIGSDWFTSQAEVATKYQFTDTQGFIAEAYRNAFGREPDEEGLAFWAPLIETGAVGRETFISAIIEGAKAPTGGSTDVAMLSNRAEIGLEFTKLNNAPGSLAADIIKLVTPNPETVSLGKAVLSLVPITGSNTGASDSGTSISDLIESLADTVKNAPESTSGLTNYVSTVRNTLIGSPDLDISSVLSNTVKVAKEVRSSPGLLENVNELVESVLNNTNTVNQPNNPVNNPVTNVPVNTPAGGSSAASNGGSGGAGSTAGGASGSVNNPNANTSQPQQFSLIKTTDGRVIFSGVTDGSIELSGRNDGEASSTLTFTHSGVSRSVTFNVANGDSIVLSQDQSLDTAATRVDGLTITGSGSVSVDGVSDQLIPDLTGLASSLSVRVGLSSDADITAVPYDNVDSYGLSSGTLTLTGAQATGRMLIPGFSPPSVTSQLQGNLNIVDSGETQPLDISFLGHLGDHTIYGGSAGDSITAYGEDSYHTVFGQAGDDVIEISGDVGSSLLVGGQGNDTITVSGQDRFAVIIGGEGADTLTGGSGGRSTVNVFGYFDVLDSPAPTSGSTISVDTIINFARQSDLIDIRALNPYFTGGSPVDAIQLRSLAGLSTANDFSQIKSYFDSGMLTASSPSTRIEAYTFSVGSGSLAGDYVLINNNDTVYSSADLLIRLASGSELPTSEHFWFTSLQSGVPDQDLVPVNQNTINGTSSNDLLIGTDADEIIQGFEGNDTLNGGGGADTLIGGAGINEYVFNTGDVAPGETVQLTGTRDIFYVQSRTEFFEMNSGGPILGLDEIRLASAVDAYFYSDQINGMQIEVARASDDNYGVDLYVFASTADTNIDLSGLNPERGVAVNIFGSLGDDNLIGTSGADNFRGYLGADTFDGGGGFDVVFYDDLTAEHYIESGIAGVAVNLSSNTILASDIETVLGTGVVVIGQGSADSKDLLPSSATLLATVGSFDTSLIGRDQFQSIEMIIGSNFGDYIALTNETGVHASGLDGADALIGGDGYNSLRGGSDSDTLSGGAGADLFGYVAYAESRIQGLNELRMEGNDVITDFETGVDKLDFYFAVPLLNMIIGQDIFTQGASRLGIGGAGAFVEIQSTNVGPSGVMGTFIYNSNTGQIYFDSLGDTGYTSSGITGTYSNTTDDALIATLLSNGANGGTGLITAADFAF